MVVINMSDNKDIIDKKEEESIAMFNKVADVVKQKEAEKSTKKE